MKSFKNKVSVYVYCLCHSYWKKLDAEKKILETGVMLLPRNILPISTGPLSWKKPNFNTGIIFLIGNEENYLLLSLDEV